MASSYDAAVVAAAEGAPWAWEELYAWLSPRILGYLRARGSRDAEGALGEVWLQLARNIATFEGDAKGFRAWAFTVAHHRVIDEARRRRRRPEDVPLDDVRAAAEERLGSMGAEWSPTATLELEDLLAYLEGLSDLQQSTLLLRVIGDLSVAQTADALGVSQSAVKTAQHRGLRRLREILATKPGPPSVTETT